MKTSILLSLVLSLCCACTCMAGGANSLVNATVVAQAGDAGKKPEVINKDIIVEELSKPDAASIAFSSDAILFGYGSAVLRDASHPQLMEIAKALNDPALAHIPFFLVDGHTCNIGTDERNCRLSKDRATSVVKYLVEKGGVPAEKLKARGFGKNDPVVSNDTEENRKKNRRVVLKSGLLELQADKEKTCAEK